MWLTGLVAPQHVGSSQTRARTRVPCISRQTLNYCATREARGLPFNCRNFKGFIRLFGVIFILNFSSVKSSNHLLAKCIPKNGESFLKIFRPKPNFYFSKENQPLKSNLFRASLVAQWLRVCLLMQGTRVRALVWEDPTCRGAAGPVSHNY